MNSTKFLLVITLLTTTNYTNAIVTIERFQPDRDKKAVLRIMQEDADLLTYESMGYAAGTTEKYIMSKNYTTDVLCEDGKTVGFINYIDQNVTLLTFHLFRQGLIHLMGVDKEYRRKGYGKMLLEHAIDELKNRNVPKIVLAVNKDNSSARELYQKTGFRCIIPDDMHDHLPQLFYERRFDIPAELLPQGNIIQRHPKASLSMLALAMLAAYAARAIYKK